MHQHIKASGVQAACNAGTNARGTACHQSGFTAGLHDAAPTNLFAMSKVILPEPTPELKQLSRDIDARRWSDVIWAISTRVDPARDSTLIESTPIDYLDFASPVAGLGSKLGIDATTKWPGEVDREWGRPIAMRADVIAKIDALWSQLNFG
jgi:hypothetical protein